MSLNVEKNFLSTLYNICENKGNLGENKTDLKY